MAGTLATPVLDGSTTAQGVLPSVYLTEAQPSALVVVGSGGVQLSGSSPALLHELVTGAGGTLVSGVAEVIHYNSNTGVYDVPPWYAPTPTGGVQLGYGAGVGDVLLAEAAGGGVQLSGTSAITQTIVRHWIETGYGGVQLSGAGTDDGNWIEQRATGGGQVSGSATVSVASLANILTATLPSTSFSSTAYISGTADVTLPSASLDAAGFVGTAAVVDAVLPSADLSLSDGTSVLSATLPRAQMTSTSLTGSVAVLSAQLPAGSLGSTGYATGTGVMDATLPRPSISATTSLGTVATMSIVARAPRVDSTGAAGVVAQLSAELPAIDAYARGYYRVSASMDVRAPSITASIDADVPRTFVETLCTNTITSALAMYENYQYNSFCEFAGMYLAAGPAGLVQIDNGDTDAGVKIDAALSTGDLDFGSEKQKRVSDFYIGMRSAGDIALTVTTDEQDPVEYTIQTFDVPRIKQRRVITAKGAKGKYWRFALRNIDGCDFEFDSMNVAAVPLSRRV